MADIISYPQSCGLKQQQFILLKVPEVRELEMNAGWCSLQPLAAGIHWLWTSGSVSESNGCLPVPLHVSLGTWYTVLGPPTPGHPFPSCSGTGVRWGVMKALLPQHLSEGWQNLMGLCKVLRVKLVGRQALSVCARPWCCSLLCFIWP